MGFSTIGDFGETPSGGAGSSGHEGVDDQSSSNDDQITITDTEVCINEDGDDVDFRIESDANDKMFVVNGGTSRIGIGTDAPDAMLEIYGATGTDNQELFAISEAGNNRIALECDFNTAGNPVIVKSDVKDNLMTLGTTTGYFGVGTRSPDTLVEVVKAAGDAEVMVSCYHDTEASTPKITFRKADNTEASPALVDDDAVLGTIDFLGHDGTNFERGAKIEARVQGTSANNDLPTELTFWTTPDGSNACAERMSIGTDGAVAVNKITTAPSAVADVAKIYAFEDGNDANTVLLLHFADLADSAAGTTSVKTQTASGDAAVSTTQKKFGTHSLRLDGTGDYITSAGASASHTDWDMGQGDWTMEFWIRFDAAPDGTNIGFMGAQTSSTSESGFYWYYEASDKRTYFRWKDTGGTRRDISYYGVQHLAATTWHHMAVVRHGTSIKPYINGSQIWMDGDNDATETVMVGSYTLNDPDNAITIGAVDAGSIVATACYMDEVRITKGVAVYKNSFTPAASAFPVTRLCTIDAGGVKRVLGEL
ncbi:hypothetical protein CMI37_21270 [Candidatus Pacearchaeota archaeon]|nr:hypothetical protein [Candidatus Pacearchaeota archaeon]